MTLGKHSDARQILTWNFGLFKTQNIPLVATL